MSQGGAGEPSQAMKDPSLVEVKKGDHDPEIPKEGGGSHVQHPTAQQKADQEPDEVVFIQSLAESKKSFSRADIRPDK